MNNPTQAFVYHTLHASPKRSRRKAQICATSPPLSPQASPKTLAVASRLREELPTLFNPNAEKDYSLYSPSVIFEDPLNKFRGVSRYAANISFLNNSPVFTSACLTLYDIAIIGKQHDTVRTRWALSMTANLPWKPVVAFTGQSDYVVDQQSGKVVQHIDYWDSLDDSSYFSMPAVRDLLAQCKPGKVNISDFGGFQLLRRTNTMEIRRFERVASDGISLTCKSKNNALEEWAVNENHAPSDSVTVRDVAVKSLDTALVSVQSFQNNERELRLELDTINHKGTVGRAFYVTAQKSGAIYEVWVELLGATVTVDT